MSRVFPIVHIPHDPVYPPMFLFLLIPALFIPSLAERMGGYSTARIVRALPFPLFLGWTLTLFLLRASNEGPSEAARWASNETASTPRLLPSLPTCHFISLVLQTSIDEIGVRVVGLRRTDGSRK